MWGMQWLWLCMSCMRWGQVALLQTRGKRKSGKSGRVETACKVRPKVVFFSGRQGKRSCVGCGRMGMQVGPSAGSSLSYLAASTRELFEIVIISSRDFAALLLRSWTSPFWYSGAHSRAILGQLMPRALLTSVMLLFLQVVFSFGLIYPLPDFPSSCARELLPTPRKPRTEGAPPSATRGTRHQVRPALSHCSATGGLATRYAPRCPALSHCWLPPDARDAACIQLPALPSASSCPRRRLHPAASAVVCQQLPATPPASSFPRLPAAASAAVCHTFLASPWFLLWKEWIYLLGARICRIPKIFC
jgi:hypothetical protein